MPGEKQLYPTADLVAFLGAMVRRYRHAKSMSQRELGAMVFVSANRIAQIELGTDPATRELMRLIDVALGAGGELVECQRHVSDPAYENYAKRFLLRQGQATIIQEYGIVIPGLLQTEQYMRVLFESSEQLLGDVPIETKMATRLARRARLQEKDAPWYRVILAESALRFGVGGPKVMWHQLAHILQTARLPKVDVQVLPASLTPPLAMNGSFCLLALPDGSHSAYSEGMLVGRYFEKPQDVERMRVIYDRVQAVAMSPEMSAAFIQQVMEEQHTWDLPPLS